MRIVTKLLLVFAVVGMLGACAPDGDPETLMIFTNVMVGTKTQCQIKPGGGASVESRQLGVLDLLVANRYFVFPLVYNGLTAVEEATGVTAESMNLESHTVTLQGAWVTYEIDGLVGPYDSPGTPAKLEKQWVPAVGSLLPENYGTVGLEAVPPPIGMLLDQDAAFNQLGSGGYLIISVQLEGTMADGTVVHSTEFHYPVIVCRGCLTTYEVPPDQCYKYPIQPDEYPCFPGQDERYSCMTGCWINDRDRPDRYAEKMAMISGFIMDLNVDLNTLELPPGFVEQIAPKPGQPTE
jgi:hypothetical protein